MSACEHLSASGISQHEGPSKVWKCDGCSWLFVMVRDGRGISQMIDVEERLYWLDDENEGEDLPHGGRRR